MGKPFAQKNIKLTDNFAHAISDERRKFTIDCIPIYEEFYPEILKEIRGIADSQNDSTNDSLHFLLSMYCFEFTNKCSCFALKDKNQIILAINSDFLISLEKSNMNCLYKLDNTYAFTGNTIAFVQMEDGINEHGLAIGFTFIYPKNFKVGFNAGLMLRYLLEKCKTAKEVIAKFMFQVIPYIGNH